MEYTRGPRTTIDSNKEGRMKVDAGQKKRNKKKKNILMKEVKKYY